MQQTRFFRSRAALRAEALCRGTQTANAARRIKSLHLRHQRSLFCLQGKRGFLPFSKQYAIFSIPDLDLWRENG